MMRYRLVRSLNRPSQAEMGVGRSAETWQAVDTVCVAPAFRTPLAGLNIPSTERDGRLRSNSFAKAPARSKVLSREK